MANYLQNLQEGDPKMYSYFLNEAKSRGMVDGRKLTAN